MFTMNAREDGDDTEDDGESDDALDTTPSKPKRTRKKEVKAGTAAKKAAKKPSKAVTTKPAKAAKSNGKAADKPKKAKKASADDVSTVQPEDKVVLAAVRKLKGATSASQFAADLGVHRRVIRHQLQRLAKDKSNGVAMKKDGFNWVVSPR